MQIRDLVLMCSLLTHLLHKLEAFYDVVFHDSKLTKAA